MTRRRAAGFTIIELLVVILIITTLTAILLPALSGAREQGRLLKELAAVRTLIQAYTMYADDHDGAVVHGYLGVFPALNHYPEVKDAQGNVLGNPMNVRYPWKLAPYLGYEFQGSLLANDQQEAIARLIASGDSPAYAISVAPSFGINAFYVGGHVDAIFPQFPYVKTLEEPSDPSSLLVFASSRSAASSSGDVIEGYHEIRIPTVDTFDPLLAPSSFGFVSPRYGGRAVTAMIDGHAETLGASELTDARRWSNAAAIADDPDWAYTP